MGEDTLSMVIVAGAAGCLVFEVSEWQQNERDFFCLLPPMLNLAVLRSSSRLQDTL